MLDLLVGQVLKAGESITVKNHNHLPPVDFQIERDSFGRLVLIDADGARHVGIEPVRAFPMTNPHHGLSLVSAEGRELIWIDDWEQLPAAVRPVLEEALAAREFAPQIHRILSVSLEVDPCYWEVQTDRGDTKFVLKSEEDVRRLDKNRALVIDAHGIRYLISDIQSLDRKSQRILERYL